MANEIVRLSQIELEGCGNINKINIEVCVLRMDNTALRMKKEIGDSEELA